MTVFVVSLATILVLGLADSSRYDLRASRNFAENIQADYILKSSLNLARALIEAPKLEGINEDWLGEPWALIASAPSLPISGVIGESRLTIVDEDGKLNLNAIAEQNSQISGNPFPGSTGQPGQGQTGSTQSIEANYWKNALREIFVQTGFEREQYDEEKHRTVGNTALDPSTQVAVLHDWIDPNEISHTSASFDGEGIESVADKTWFFNRPIRNVSELLLVPGFTLERVARVAPFVRSSHRLSNSSAKINVNTAPLQTLIAIGFPEGQAAEIVSERTNLPITNEILNALTAGDTQLRQRTKVTSNEFSVYARVIMPNGTRWLRATVAAQGTPQRRRTVVRTIELF